MTLKEACTNVAKKIFKIGDHLTLAGVTNYCYEVIDKKGNELFVIAKNIKTKKQKVAYTERYHYLDFYKKPIEWSAEQKS